MSLTSNHRHLQFLQHLRDGRWVLVSELPDRPQVQTSLLDRGWIECEGDDGNRHCRITDIGLSAMRQPIDTGDLAVATGSVP